MVTENSSMLPGWWSWADILSNAHRLGIPNFQRGAVWDAGNRAALLESIYEQSPCGSFVFWEPDDNGDPWRHGVPLRSFGSDAPLWLVDGQQRTRAMLDIFEELLAPHRTRHAPPLVREGDLTALEKFLRPCQPLGPDAEDHEPEFGDESLDDGRKADALWMVVLPAMRVFDRGSAPFFGSHTESRSVRRGSIFRRLQPLPRMRLNSQGKLRPVPPIPAGSVPLAALIASGAVFHNTELRDAAIAALRNLRSGSDDLARLDDLLPWGPQFVTGHAYETPGSSDAPAIAMTWSHIGRRRKEATVTEQVKRLEDLLGEDWSLVFERFAGMLTGSRFAVGWLPSSDISAAIDAYVRINRAGIRVRAEEQALALLTRARPSLLDDLADFSRRRDGGSDTPVGRAALLAHASERHMGFPLWMATVTRFAALLLLGDTARAWLGTSAIDKDTFSYRLDRVGPKETDKGKVTWARAFDTPGMLIGDAVAQASAALLLIDDILSQELHLDHRMARSQTVALTPLLELFSRVPAGEMDELQKDCSFRAAVARVLHCILLHPGIDQADMESLVLAAHGIDQVAVQTKASPLPQFGSDCPGDHEHVHRAIRQSLHRLVINLAEVWSGHHSRRETPTDLSDPMARLSQFAGDAFENDVNDARSQQHRALGWLYAIERRNGAREFSWRAQIDGHSKNPRTGVRRLPAPRDEKFLGRPDIADRSGTLCPEKQHVVPFSIATRIVGKGGTRATASPANAIGNLTWLSQRQNSLEALSDNWTVMDLETDRENLEARGMLAPVTIDGHPATVLDEYLELSRGLANGDEALTSQPEHWLPIYDAFCKGRSEWMIGQMRGWLETPLEAEVLGWLKGESG